MTKLLETIKCVNGIAQHLPYHQARLEKSLRALKQPCRLNLETLIDAPANGTWRCRIVYDGVHAKIEYFPYSPRTVNALKALCADTIDYALKYADRSALDALFMQRGSCDDVVIIQNGYLSDTTIANIAIYENGRWLTPASPLLEGTTRARLLDEEKLFAGDISLERACNAERIAIFNALLGFVDVPNGIMA